MELSKKESASLQVAVTQVTAQREKKLRESRERISHDSDRKSTNEFSNYFNSRGNSASGLNATNHESNSNRSKRTANNHTLLKRIKGTPEIYSKKWANFKQ